MKRPPVIVIQLVHISGPLKGEIQEFTEPLITIGRHPSCQLRFPAEITGISRKHADIVREGNQFKVTDHSTNGTFVNGKKIQEVVLKNGDVLAFSEGGPKVSFLTQMREGLPEVEKAAPQRLPEEVRLTPEPERVQPSREMRRPDPPAQDLLRPRIERTEEAAPRNVKVPLIIQYGPTLRSYKELPITLGKNPKCDFIIDHPAIFDHHAQIFFSQNQYWIKDLTGQKAVQINRMPLSSETPLKLNDDVSLSSRGPVFRFLGEGRLAEISEPAGRRTSGPSEKRGNPQPESRKPKGLKSVFKKMLDR